MTGRVCCSVPSCRRTRPANGYVEWVCGTHWAAVPQALRREYTVSKRVWRKGGGDGHDPHPAEVWARCRQAAIDKATGLG